MKTHMVGKATLALIVVAAGLPIEALAQDRDYENLQVLPEDISRRELTSTMLANLEGLGLPRRGNEGCLFCHEGSMDVPRSEWDYASDARVEKRKAREMMAMTHEVNRRISAIESRIDPDFEVTCGTCHKGRTDPRPLDRRLIEAYEESGYGALDDLYVELRERYFGADAYDFRVQTLFELAGSVAAAGSLDDAIAVSELNERFFPGSHGARRGTLMLSLNRTLSVGGVDSVLADFDRRYESEATGIVTAGLLDGLGWPLYRQDRVDDALRLFRHNLERFPSEFAPHESLADALVRSGRDVEAGLAVIERWLDQHPDDDRARRVLLNLRELASGR